MKEISVQDTHTGGNLISTQTDVNILDFGRKLTQKDLELGFEPTTFLLRGDSANTKLQKELGSYNHDVSPHFKVSIN